MICIPDDVLKFRNQALYIKTNIQILRDIWKLQPQFKEKKTGAFYKVIQENCIFRIVLETYKMLYDSSTIRKMANDICREVDGIEELADKKNELLNMKRQFSSDLNKFKNIEDLLRQLRNKVYAHNDQEYHWFSASHIKQWGLTDSIYNDIFEISNICIDYCNGILRLFNIDPIYEYSNHDDVKRLFGMKTESDEEREK